MALISVGGVDLPTPSELQVGIQDLSKGERNANGMMIIERIATKIKLEISYTFLSKADLSKVLNAVAPVFFSVSYLDPQTDSMRTGTFYCGDRNCGMLSFTNGVPRYKDVKFNLIEK
jgi:hypothetical protein